MSVTRLPWLRNHRVREFRGIDDLTTAIVASSCIMPGWPVWMQDCRCGMQEIMAGLLQAVLFRPAV